MPARPPDYTADEELREVIALGEAAEMPLRRLGRRDMVAVVLQHRRKHDLQERYSWESAHVTQTGPRAVTLSLPVAELPARGRWALWAEATVGGTDIRHPPRGRNIRIAEA